MTKEKKISQSKQTIIQKTFVSGRYRCKNKTTSSNIEGDGLLKVDNELPTKTGTGQHPELRTILMLSSLLLGLINGHFIKRFLPTKFYIHPSKTYTHVDKVYMT
ncbi:hypothetical protein L798_06205 [Zootermopsis nevadensis]|uniref:Uncharacterized protein n=1 Tax=Zootermopsis nevadensis TaxID=136037 RepID=A0A067RJ99_ZOONE|nr:hypothetical protein L798_06205 [Zootermopsis nevadensis]